jgi:ligand-binding sensor domain-containing protein
MMPFRYLCDMQKLLSLLPIVLMITSCAGQAKSNLPQENKESNRSERIPNSTVLPDTSLPIDDPYFIVTKDTFSTHGPRSITRNLLQDRRGNYWFSTWEGIIGYDGKRFTNYTLKFGLRRFHTFSILEDRAGNIWFGSIGGGVYRCDPSALQKKDENTFTLFTTADGLPHNYVLSMFEDRDGIIWFGTEDGVSSYDPSASSGVGGKIFTNYSTASGLGGPSVNSITQDKSGIIWFATRYGVESDVSYYDPSTMSKEGSESISIFKNKIGDAFSNVRSILNDQAGNIWIGGQTGLYRYDGKNLERLSTNFIGYIYEDKAGNIWLSESEENGMSLTRYDGKTFTKIKSDEQVFGIMEDKAGYIWFGTVNGAYRYDPAARAGGPLFTNFN